MVFEDVFEDVSDDKLDNVPTGMDTQLGAHSDKLSEQREWSQKR